MNATDRFYRIVEDGLCIGCGLCQSLAGSGTIRMSVTPEQTQRPVVCGELSDAMVDRIYDVCPGTRIEGLPEALVDGNTRADLVWGHYQQLTRAYAADPEVRHRGATGGVMTALGQYLLSSQRVERIVHVKVSGTQPTFGEAHISLDAEAVLTGAGSRYGPTAPLLDMLAILDAGHSFAFMGKPCDVTALRNLARSDPRVDALCKIMLVPVCGGYMDAQGMRNFLQREKTEFDELTEFHYRGYGCPGPTRFVTKNGRTVEKNYLDFWGEDESSWSLPFRCKVCPDGIGEAADIAAADTWPGGSPTREAQLTDLGTNAIVARTRAGRELMLAAERDGAIVIECEIDIGDLNEYQPHQVARKLAVWARYVGLANAGRLVPKVARLRIAELAKTQGIAKNLHEARGTRRRVRLDRNREPRPVAAAKNS